MRAIRGWFNGRVVILEEPSPVDHEVPVIVEFPEESIAPGAGTPGAGKFHWDEAQAISDGYEGSLADEVIRQRREPRER
jgi:hypothetical protein